MIIIFEGHDNSGKTTIAKAFADSHPNAVYIKDKYLQKAALENVNQSYARYQLGLFACVFDPNKLVVIDRAILSHFVYSAIFNQPSDNEIIADTLELLKGKAIYIICYKTNEIEPDEIFSHQPEIRKAFNTFPKHYPYYYLDTTDENLDSQLKSIEAFIKDAESNMS